MLKRVGKSSLNTNSSSQRVKKAKDRVDILPTKHNVWLKQVCSSVCVCVCVCVFNFAKEALVRPSAVPVYIYY